LFQVKIRIALQTVAVVTQRLGVVFAVRTAMKSGDNVIPGHQSQMDATPRVTSAGVKIDVVFVTTRFFGVLCIKIQRGFGRPNTTTTTDGILLEDKETGRAHVDAVVLVLDTNVDESVGNTDLIEGVLKWENADHKISLRDRSEDHRITS
jgi:hypothetical protein